MLAAQAVLWYLAVQAAALAVLPLCRRVFAYLPDGGYAFSKPLGLLLLAWSVWFPGMLGFVHYTRATLAVALVVLGVACWSIWGREALAWARVSRGQIAFQEALLLAVGLAGVGVRMYNPDVNGQEKFMDMAFFRGFLATTVLPAEDSWLAGYAMPYYPFGYLLTSVPTRLAGLPAPVGYNLALVLVMALSALLCASLAANLVACLRRATAPGRAEWAVGTLAGFLLVAAGNLVGPLELLAARGFNPPGFWEAVAVKNLKAAPSPTWLPLDGGWWWHASRVIPTIQPDGITEPPYFSFLLGDLHPHYMVLPLELLILALVLALLLAPGPRRDWPWLLVAGLGLGVLLPAHTWDVATFWTLFASAAGLVVWRASGGARPSAAVMGTALAPLGLGIGLFSPYFIGYSSQPLGVGLVDDRTPLVSLLIIFGPLLVLTLLGVLRVGPPGEGASSLGWLRAGLGLALVGLLFAAVERPTLGLGLALLGLVALRAWPAVRRWAEAKRPADSSDGALAGPESAGLYTLLLAGLACGILAAAEVVFIRDVFGTRMNTVFKFYYHVWLLLALAGAVGAGMWLLDAAGRRPGVAVRLVGGLAVALAVGLGAVYPVAATMTRSSGFREPTLDGLAWLERGKRGEAEAIRWLGAQPGRPVVLEAVGPPYREFARVSTFSGLPTVLGWDNHEGQWRGHLPEFGRRKQDVETIYRRGDRETALPLLERYHVRYVYVGSLEREAYGRDVEVRLGRWLQPVFQREGVTVYQVPPTESAS